MFNRIVNFVVKKVSSVPAVRNTLGFFGVSMFASIIHILFAIFHNKGGGGGNGSADVIDAITAKSNEQRDFMSQFLRDEMGVVREEIVVARNEILAARNDEMGTAIAQITAARDNIIGAGNIVIAQITAARNEVLRARSTEITAMHAKFCEMQARNILLSLLILQAVRPGFGPLEHGGDWR